MAIPLQKLSCMLIISVFLLFFLPLSLSLNRCPLHESQALLCLKAALNESSDYYEGYLSSWVNGTDCCTHWDGVSCDNRTNHVVSVDAFSISRSFHGAVSESLCQLRFLTSLTIYGLPPGTPIPPCLGNLSFMQSLTLEGNGLRGMIPRFLCFLTSLKVLRLSRNNFNGSIPSCLGNLTSLTELGIGENQLSGSIPASLGSLSLLKDLYLAENQLSGSLPDSLGNLSMLDFLSISNNQLSENIPSSFAQLSSLTILYVTGNRFNEATASSLPPSLVELSLTVNFLSYTFFDKLTSLVSLYLSHCVLNISTTWIPPFQLIELHMVSCMIDSEFPSWISTQFRLASLELSNASLVGVIPSWLWETSPMLQHLNLSGSQLEGSLSSNINKLMQLDVLDVSRNGLSGRIPSMWSSYVSILLFNDNLFSGNISPSLGTLDQLQVLNLGHNKISGVIPTSLSNCSSLVILNLGDNNLQGSLPYEFGKLSELNSLVVHSNNLNGSFPPSISNCSNLQVLDIGNNLFGGEIPTSVRNISNLRVLVMNENNFIGSIPSEIGQLMSLQILLLSSNQISGLIPHAIVSLQEMAIENQDGFVLSPFSNIRQSYQDGLYMTSKGRDEHYTYILSTLTSIDLSNNKLEGELASDFGKLKGLKFLNLSMNNLSGTIPNGLGEMSQLESLDLSRNRFSGQIPIELDSLSSLGFLNLSNNQLSRCIPQGRHITTFGESSYLGNPNLWGCPLPINCSWPQFASPPPFAMNKEKENTKYPWYGISLGLSYGVAFATIVSLILIKMSWRRKYFNKVDTILKFLFPWMKNMTL